MTTIRRFIFADSEALSAAAADRLAAIVESAVADRGACAIVLAGGGTPRALYRLLAQSPQYGRLPWDRVDFFWGDERLVPVDDEASNVGQARRLLLDHLPITESRIHPMRGELASDAAVADYTEQLRAAASPGGQWPRFDLVLLGLGSDGHTASLFPGPIPDVELCAPVMAVTADYEARPGERITLTPVAINAARHLLFLVSGRDKAAAVAASLTKTALDPVRWPAQRLHPTVGQIAWYLDQAAAGRLA